MTLSGRVKGAVAGVAAAAALVAGTSYAMAGGDTVTACVHAKGGGLYQAKKCSRGDTKLDWGTTGPTGRRGPKGAEGATGARGVTGATGPAGTPGTNGVNGVDGTPGPGVASTTMTVASGQQFQQHAIAVGPDLIVSICNGGGDGEIAFNHPAGAQFLHGTITVSGAVLSGDVKSLHATQSLGEQDYSNGVSMVATEDDSGQTRLLGAAGGATPTSYQLHLLVDDASHAYIVDVAESSSATTCQMTTTVTPTNGDAADVTS